MENNMIDIHLKNFEDRERKRFTAAPSSYDVQFSNYIIDDIEIDLEYEGEPQEFKFVYPKSLLDENASFTLHDEIIDDTSIWQEIENIDMKYNELSLINYNYYLYWIHNETVQRSPKDFVMNNIFSKYYNEKFEEFNLLLARYCTGFYYMGIFLDLNWLIETFNQLFIKTKAKCRSLEGNILDYDFYKMKKYADLFDDDELLESNCISEYLKYYLTIYSYNKHRLLLRSLKYYIGNFIEIQNDYLSTDGDQNSDDYVFDLIEIFTDKHKIKANDFLDILVRNGFASESEWIQPHYTSRIFYEEMRNRGIMKSMPFKLVVKYFNSKYDNFSSPSFVKPVDFGPYQAQEYKELIASEIDLIK